MAFKTSYRKLHAKSKIKHIAASQKKQQQEKTVSRILKKRMSRGYGKSSLRSRAGSKGTLGV